MSDEALVALAVGIALFLVGLATLIFYIRVGKKKREAERVQHELNKLELERQKEAQALKQSVKLTAVFGHVGMDQPVLTITNKGGAPALNVRVELPVDAKWSLWSVGEIIDEIRPYESLDLGATVPLGVGKRTEITLHWYGPTGEKDKKITVPFI